jgi:uncharacterized protein with FMN-binding domain
MKSKKIVFILLAILLICPAMHSQKSVDQIFTEFSKEKEITRVGIGRFVMTFAGLFTDVMGVTGVEVLSFDECNPSVKERLNTAIASLKDNKYETMISVNEETGRTKILVKIEKETIRELIVLTSGDDPAIVRIKGKIKPSDFDKVINQNKK